MKEMKAVLSRLSSGAWFSSGSTTVPGGGGTFSIRLAGWCSWTKSFLKAPVMDHSPLDLRAPPPKFPTQERVFPPRSGPGGVPIPVSAACGRVLARFVDHASPSPVSYAARIKRPSRARRSDQRFPEAPSGTEPSRRLLQQPFVESCECEEPGHLSEGSLCVKWPTRVTASLCLFSRPHLSISGVEPSGGRRGGGPGEQKSFFIRLIR